MNGAGSSFSDLPPAVAAAVPGDILLVRAYDPTVAVYQAPTISKALTVIGIGGQPALVGQLEVDAVPAGQHVVLRDLAIGPFQGATGTFGDCALTLVDNIGSVHLQNVDRERLMTWPLAATGWRIDSCELVTLVDCSCFVVTPLAMHEIVDTSLCIASGTEFRSGLAPPLFGGTFVPTVTLIRSEMVLVDSVVQGTVSFFGGGGPGFELCDANLQVGPGSRVSPGGQVAAFRLDPGCAAPSELTIAFGASIGAFVGVPFTFAPVTSMGASLTSSTSGADTLSVQVTGEPSGIAGLAFGVPAPAPTPLFGGSLFLDPASVVLFDIVMLDAQQGKGSWSAVLPSGLPPGISQWLQAVVLSNGALTLTQPAVVTTS
ncbi:MAG: hypothetical protein AB8H80_07215 [Planctomycetota bacterium]